MNVTFHRNKAIIKNSSSVTIAEFDNICQMVTSGNTAWLLEYSDKEESPQLLTKVSMNGEVLKISSGITEDFIKDVTDWQSSETYLLKQGRVVLLKDILEDRYGEPYHRPAFNRFLIPTKYGVSQISYSIDPDGDNTYYVTYDDPDRIIIQCYVSDNYVCTDEYVLLKDNIWSQVL